MKIILLSGCSGERLWPLSNEVRSKQFLQLLQNENKVHESMLQRIYRQLREAGIRERVSVVTGEAQADSVKSQLDENADLILEPARRGTFPAAALAVMELLQQSQMPEEEIVGILPVDSCVDTEYFRLLFSLEETIRQKLAEVALIGINPSYPSAKYGYILPAPKRSLQQNANQAACFGAENYKEKPSEEEAAALIEQGALWNAGIFVFRLSFFKKLIQTYVKDKEEPGDAFYRLPQGSFDHLVLEKGVSLAVIPYTGKWKDLGTWNTLTEEMSEETIGFVLQGEGCQNTHVINELSIPVLVLGAENMVVAASPDGILISDKHKSSYMAPYAQQLKNRPMYEERRWGEYKVLDYNQYSDAVKSLTKHLSIHAGSAISYQRHAHRDEIWTIVDGEGELIQDGQLRRVSRGDVAYIVKGQLHAMRAVSDLQLIEVQIGSELAEEDIERFEWEWK